jgi:serine/threonine protein kinase
MHPEYPQRLGDFELLRELGRGGVGIVYEARQVSLNRKVALKVLSGGLGLTPKAVQRFHREAEAAAKLHHTNIVPIYATGEQDDTHFYAMELIDGPSLDHVVRQLREGVAGAEQSKAPEPLAHLSARPAPPQAGAEVAATGPYVENSGSSNSVASLTSSSLNSDSHYFDTVARMVAEVADALGYAHKNGVIHRDIKPSNFLLSPEGRLSINDFGLARVLEQPGMTVSGEFVGTPAYMSPEQIAVGRIALDHRTDIYSLGATLYELLTLERPHTGKSREQVLAQIVQKEPKAPRRLQKKVPMDLETICLKCLEKDPDRRYQTATELAEDLRRFVNRFAISARRAGPVQRLVKWAKRRPAAAASLICVFLAVCVAIGFAYVAHRTEQQRLVEQDQAKARLAEVQKRAQLQLLEEKIRNSYLVATTGDEKRTEQAIKEIEALGASTGQVRLLRGMVAFFGGNSEVAIKELKQAVNLLPTSVTARALLAVSYTDFGSFEHSGYMLLEMEALPPASAEDYLFKGYAYEYNDPGQGLADLDEGIKRHDSPLGRALRAFARSNRAAESGDVKYAEDALVDANAARGMLPDNPLVLCASLYARTVAANIFQDAKLNEQRVAALKEAALDITALQPFIELPNPAMYIWTFYNANGENEKSLEIAHRSLKSSRSPTAAFLCAIDLYQKGNFSKALECLDQRRQGYLLGDIMRALALAELPNGDVLALQEYNEITRKYTLSAIDLQYCRVILLLLGKKEMARAIFKNYGSVPGLKAESSKEFYEGIRLFGIGELSEDKYLSKAGASRHWQLVAHFDIALFRLADGDRDGALDHLQKAVGTKTYWIGSSFWCQMMLTRLVNDPEWPHCMTKK